MDLGFALQNNSNATIDHSITTSCMSSVPSQYITNFPVAPGQSMSYTLGTVQSCGVFRPNTRNPGIAIRGVADQRKIVRNQLGTYAKFCSHAIGVPDHLGPSVNLHDAIVAYALRKVFIGRPNANFLHAGIPGRDSGCRGKRIIGLELGHRPYWNPHRQQRVLERLELCTQCRLNSLPRFVPFPKLIAERLDNVIRGDAHIPCSLIEHLQHGIEHAGNRPESPILITRGATQPVEMAEEFVGSIDQMNDHVDISSLRPGPLVAAGSRGNRGTRTANY